MRNNQGVRGAKRLLGCQLGLSAVIAITAGVVSGLPAALSALLGGMVSIIPNAYFSWAVFRFNGARAAGKIMNSIYKGEAVKIFLSLLLFSLVFAFFHINPVVFFVTYILVQAVFWLAPLIFDNSLNSR